MLREGDAAPDFVLKDPDGKDVRLSGIRGPLVLYFYPKDHTLGCTIQAKGFRDHHEDIARLGATVVGVSLDKPEDHCSFRDKHQLPFILLADPDGRVHDLYDAWRTMLFGRNPMAVRRCTFLIDEAGIIRRTYRTVNVFRHAESVFKDLDRLKAQSEWGGARKAEKERKRRLKEAGLDER